MTNITAPRFTDADAAREHLEALHWPHGPVCPHCRSLNAKRLPEQRGRPSKAHPEGAIRKGLVQCNDCRKQFTVTVGTVFEDSKVPLHKWLLANHLMVASKKGVSAHQLHRMLGVTYKTAWFMAHRIREAMIDVQSGPMGGDGGVVEADETYIGNRKGKERGRGGFQHKMKVVSLVDRNTGASRSFRVGMVAQFTIGPILAANVSPEAFLMTDEHIIYKGLGWNFSGHGTVNHGKEEYVNRDKPHLHTNTIEGFFSVFKRGMKGVYQHCGEQHLQRYLREFDFRYTHRSGNGVDDTQRADIALMGIVGKRLTYRRTGNALV